MGRVRLIAERLRRTIYTGLLTTAIITTTGHAGQIIVKPDFTINFADNWSLAPNGNGSSTGFRVEDTSNLAFAVGSFTQLSANISLDDAAPTILSRGPFVDSGRAHLGNQDFLFTVYGDTTSSRIELNYGFYAISGGKWFVLALVFNEKDRQTVIPSVEAALATFEFNQSTAVRTNQPRQPTIGQMTRFELQGRNLLGRIYSPSPTK